MAEVGVACAASHLGTLHTGELSSDSVNEFSSKGFEKLGHPQPDSNLSDEENSGSPVVIST
jgi:hypothetical protein